MNDKLYRFVSGILALFAFSFLVGIPIILYAQTNSVAAPEGSATFVWTQLGYLLPLLAPVIVGGMKMGADKLEKHIKRELLPYICVAIAIAISVLMDMAGKININPLIHGSLAGAVGIGARELLNKGVGMITEKFVGKEPPAVAPK